MDNNATNGSVTADQSLYYGDNIETIVIPATISYIGDAFEGTSILKVVYKTVRYNNQFVSPAVNTLYTGSVSNWASISFSSAKASPFTGSTSELWVNNTHLIYNYSTDTFTLPYYTESESDESTTYYRVVRMELPLDVGQYAFYHCINLREIVIPESVVEIEPRSVGIMEIREYTSADKI